MGTIKILIYTLTISIIGCNKIKLEEIPCPHDPENICGERVKRLINKKWQLDGWHIDRFGAEGEQVTAYRSGEFKYSEGTPSHAKWFTRAKAKEFDLAVVEKDSAENIITIKSGKESVLYQLNFVENDLEYVFRIPQGRNGKIDTIFSKKLNVEE